MDGSACLRCGLPWGVQWAIVLNLLCAVAAKRGVTVSCDPTTLANNAECLDKEIPDGEKLAAVIYLLAQIAGSTEDPGTLANNATCISAQIPPGTQMAVVISLLCQIAGV